MITPHNTFSSRVVVPAKLRKAIWMRQAGYQALPEMANWKEVVDSKLNWQVAKLPCHATAEDGTLISLTEKALVRTDVNHSFGTVGPEYGVVQNQDLCNAMDATGLPYVALTVQQQGKKVFAYQMMRENLTIAGEPYTLYLVGSNGHGGMSFELQLRLVNMLCKNGLSLELLSAGLKTRHTKNILHRIDAATQQLTNVAERAKASLIRFQQLAKAEMGEQEVKKFFEYLFPTIATGNANSQTKQKLDAMQHELELVASIHPGKQNTAYGAAMAVTAAIDHHLAFDEATVESAISGSLANIRQQAMQYLYRYTEARIATPNHQDIGRQVLASLT